VEDEGGHQERKTKGADKYSQKGMMG